MMVGSLGEIADSATGAVERRTSRRASNITPASDVTPNSKRHAKLQASRRDLTVMVGECPPSTPCGAEPSPLAVSAGIAPSRSAGGTPVLRDGVAQYPTSAPSQENLAVPRIAANDVAGVIAACETTLSPGSDIPNVNGCLCEAQCRAGLAVVEGRTALEAKDRHFGAPAPIATPPPGLPSPFNPSRPQENVIACGLWGHEPRYQVPLPGSRIGQNALPQFSKPG